MAKIFRCCAGLLLITLEQRGVRDVSPEQAEKDVEAINASLQEGGYIGYS